MELINETKSFHCKAFCTLLLILLKFPQSYGQIQTEGMIFFKATLCDLNDRLTDRCSVRVPNSRSKLECLLNCMDENSCIGASLDENGDCFKHYECPSITSCTTEFHNHVYVSKQCDNHGAWVPSKGKCQCINGWVGAACQKYPRTILELLSNGYEGEFEHYFLDPENDMKNLIPISGSVSQTHSHIEVMSNLGLGGFNRSWAGYRDGFRDAVGSYKVLWIGLKWLRALTQAGYTTLVLVCRISEVGQLEKHYRDFRVSDEADGFSYTHGTTTTINRGSYRLGDCLRPYQNTRFSTWDRDGDDDADKNCASRAGSAWWYKDCNNPCNVLGWRMSFANTKLSYELMSVLEIDLTTEDAMFRMWIMMP